MGVMDQAAVVGTAQGFLDAVLADLRERSIEAEIEIRNGTTEAQRDAARVRAESLWHRMRAVRYLLADRSIH